MAPGNFIDELGYRGYNLDIVFSLNNSIEDGQTAAQLSLTGPWQSFKLEIVKQKNMRHRLRRRGLMLSNFGDQEFTVLRRLAAPKTAVWMDHCSICLQTITAVRSYSRRTASLLLPGVKDVGYMITNKRAGLSAHINCLYFAAGKKMVQDFRVPAEEQLEGFSVSSIKELVKQNSRRRCGHCRGLGASSQCANMKCRGKNGFFHFPCGLRSGNTQQVKPYQTFCLNHQSRGDKKRRQVKMKKGTASILDNDPLQLQPIDWLELLEEMDADADHGVSDPVSDEEEDVEILEDSTVQLGDMDSTKNCEGETNVLYEDLQLSDSDGEDDFPDCNSGREGFTDSENTQGSGHLGQFLSHDELIASKGSEAGSAAKKILITKDRKIIGHQLAPPGKVAIPNPNKIVGGSLASASPSVSTAVGASQSPVQQWVQIVKSADGKIQVRGLLPGQQLVQMPDGRLQIFSSKSQVSGGTPVKSAETVLQSSTPQTPTIQPQQLQQLLPKPSPVASPSKTYTIQRNPNVTPTPIQPANNPVAGPGVGKQKVFGIQGLGNNTVNIKDGQLDHKAANGIAKKLASGGAKLGNVKRKQVLVILGQEETPAPAPVTKVPSPPPPAPAPVAKPAPLNSITVTAQLVQTGQGPRIIMQGLQGVQLEQQQQVKTQLLKQQSLARQEGNASQGNGELGQFRSHDEDVAEIGGSSKKVDIERQLKENEFQSYKQNKQIKPNSSELLEKDQQMEEHSNCEILPQYVFLKENEKNSLEFRNYELEQENKRLSKKVSNLNALVEGLLRDNKNLCKDGEKVRKIKELLKGNGKRKFDQHDKNSNLKKKTKENISSFEM